jgi:hypothetical protein
MTSSKPTTGAKAQYNTQQSWISKPVATRKTLPPSREQSRADCRVSARSQGISRVPPAHRKPIAELAQVGCQKNRCLSASQSLPKKSKPKIPYHSSVREISPCIDVLRDSDFMKIMNRETIAIESIQISFCNMFHIDKALPLSNIRQVFPFPHLENGGILNSIVSPPLQKPQPTND